MGTLSYKYHQNSEIKMVGCEYTKRNKHCIFDLNAIRCIFNDMSAIQQHPFFQIPWSLPNWARKKKHWSNGVGHVNVQSCRLIIFQSQPISLQYSEFELPIRNYKHHQDRQEFPMIEKIIPMLTCPIAKVLES